MAKTKKTAPARRPASPKRAPKANRLAPQTAEYRHKEEALARPDVGTQPQFRKKAPPRTYRYDSSLAPPCSTGTVRTRLGNRVRR